MKTHRTRCDLALMLGASRGSQIKSWIETKCDCNFNAREILKIINFHLQVRWHSQSTTAAAINQSDELVQQQRLPDVGNHWTLAVPPSARANSPDAVAHLWLQFRCVATCQTTKFNCLMALFCSLWEFRRRSASSEEILTNQHLKLQLDSHREAAGPVSS